MGAGHSGKHQLGPAAAAAAAAEQQKPGGQKVMGEVNGSGKFGKHSFRKGMMLLQNGGSQTTKSNQSSTSKKKSSRRSSAISDEHEKINTNQQENISGSDADEYYIPRASSSSNQTPATLTAALANAHNNRQKQQQQQAPMNNYVTMQQQLAMAAAAAAAAATGSSSQSMRGGTRQISSHGADENGNNNYNNNNGYPLPIEPAMRVYGASANNKPMEMNSVRAGNSLASSNSISHDLGMTQFNRHHQASTPKGGQQQPSFHLSRAINTKTTSHHLLNHHHNNNNNNHVSSRNMNNNNNNSTSSSGGSSSSSTTSDAMMQNSGRKLHRTGHSQQQQQISSPATTAAAIQHNNLIKVRGNNQRECCLLNDYYGAAAAAPTTTTPASYVSSAQQQQQPLWQPAAYRDPAFYSAYNSDEQRYFQQLDECDNTSSSARRRSSHLRNSMHQDQPPHDPMGHHYNASQQYQQQNPYSSHMLSPTTGNQLPIHYNRSYSFGSSLTLDPKKIRSQNPLASLFQPPTANISHQQYANTIQVTRRNKSAVGQQLATTNLDHPSWSAAAAQTTSNGRSAPGSLKRVKSSLLSAQQASYEAMRTIDMYLIRQIARSCQDFEMEQKIELEIRLRELAAQSILEARNEIDVLEVEKSLLTSDQRMNHYASHLEQQRKKLSNPSLSTDSGRGSKTENHQRQRSTTGRQTTGTTTTTRSDVVGGPPGGSSMNGDTSSPSFSSLSNSQSPLKLSPVSGQSANDDSSQTTQPATKVAVTSFTSRSHHSRTGLRHSQKSSSSGKSSLSARVRAKSKRREQSLQQLAKQNNLDYNMVLDSRASISVSEIRIPLMWRDVDHFKNRGDYKRFAVFCLLKIDSQIYDTQLITDVDRQVTDVTFDDFIVFNNIDYDFELTLEVYSCVYLEQFSFSSTPRKLKEKLTSSIGRAMGKRLAVQTASPSYTKELEAYDKSYRFALIASASLQLEDASSSVKTYDLVLMSPSAHNRHHQPTTPTTLSRSYHNHQDNYYGSSNANHSADLTSANTSKNASKNTLPLFGHFCCRLFVRPDAFEPQQHQNQQHSSSKNMINSALI